MTNDIPTPQRAEANAEKAPAQVRVAEPSMFDTPEWTDGPKAPGAVEVKFAGVRFQRVGKIYHYIADGVDVKVGTWVIVDTARGRQMGQVASLRPPRDKNNLDAFKRIERIATGRDMAMRHYYENKELEAMIACRAESSALKLPIKIVKAEYSFDGQTLTLLYSSDQEERVETNELRQAMSRLYRARIEARQVSPREVAKIVGGMGACGIEQRCCSRFLTEFSPISIKHAKEQGLSLNPHDITGMCGRLRCCLIYEYEQYVEARRHLPKKNAIVGTPSGQGKVVEVLPMRDSVAVLISEGEAMKEIVVHREQIVPLEELKRLQEKAASGTCDKHEGGGCDCGKDKPKTAEAGAQPAALTEPAAPPEMRPSTPAPAGVEESPAQKRKKKNKKAKPGTEGRAAPDTTAQSQPRAPQETESHKRHMVRPKHQHQHPPRRDGPEQTTNTDPGGTAEQSRPARRPLRRPLQRRSST